ncbi:MAG TPA: hypothetical protein VIN40_06720 [Candidatus Tyrphobacter sp.]
MNLSHAYRLGIAIAAAAALLAPQVAMAASTFYGEAIHVSTTNIKVRNPRSGQILSFEILPHFYRIFSANGKTTYQMKDVHDGQYVAIIYDQKALGMRHADDIYIMNNANQRLQKP